MFTETFDETTTVGQAMISNPKLCDESTTVGEVRRMFLDTRVQAIVVVRDRQLIAVVERKDVGAELPGTASVAGLGCLGDRVVSPDELVTPILSRMLRDNRRRLAVVDPGGALIGMLCLKRTLKGFCSDQDVLNRLLDPH